MAIRASGGHYRKGMSLNEIMDRFPDEETARQWIEDSRWPNGKPSQVRFNECPDRREASDHDAPLPGLQGVLHEI